jgi:hypothetical protein
MLYREINLLNTKRNLLYISNQSVPRCKHFPLQLYKPTNQLYQANPAVRSQIHTTQSQHHVELLNVKPGGM